MHDSSLPHLIIEMAQAAEAVRVILKEVRVDGADTQAKHMGIVFHCLPIVFHIPGNVDGDTRASTGYLVDLGRVCQLLAQVTGCSRPVKHFEARPRIAVAPRGSLDSELLNGRDDAVDSDTSLLQAIFDF